MICVFPPPPVKEKQHILTVFLYFTIYHVCRTFDHVVRAQKTLLVAKAAVEKAKAFRLYDLNLRPQSVMDGSYTAAVSQTRFVQGGDHFMSTSFTSRLD